MKTLILSLLAVGLMAQTYPSSIFVPPVAGDNVASTLSSAMGAGDTVAVVASGSGWVAGQYAYICDGTQSGPGGKCASTYEVMLVTAVSGNVLTLTRAQAGTAAIAHLKGRAISNAITSPYVTLPNREIVAIENALGPNLVNVLNSGPAVLSSTYDFPAQIPGGNLVVGNNTVTMSPVPGGVNGTDLHHYLYVSGGTGTAESCLITGGSGTAGQFSGPIIINCAHTHTGGWTIRSASAGIVEAASSISNVGTVTLARTAMAIHFTIILPTAVSIQGQGFTGTGNTGGSILVCDVAANPCMMIADGLGTASGQGFGIHSNYELYGPGSNTGLWIGGDSSSILTPSAWTGSYMRFYNVASVFFTTALNHRRGNFDTYTNCAFAGLSKALTLPTGGGGERQPLEFYGTVLTVPTGAAVQMDDSGFDSTPVQFFGGQVSGAITGNDIYWESYATHYEPNDANTGILTATGAAAIVKIHGGILSSHGTALSAMITASGTGFYDITIEGSQAQCDVGMVTTSFVNFVSTVGGALKIADIDFNQAGTFTHLYTISKATLDAATRLEIQTRLPYTAGAVTAGSTLTFNGSYLSYPVVQSLVITGGTVSGSGITAVTGITPYSNGTLTAQSAQTFTTGATIGNTISMVAGIPYQWYFDGTKIWLNASPQWMTTAGTSFQNAHTVIGTCTLGTNCAVTLVGASGYTNGANFVCTAVDNTAAAAVKVVNTSANTFTITGTGTDQISFICVGN